MTLKKPLAISLLILAPVFATEPPKIVFVQAVHVDLKEEPKASSATVASVNRGEAGQVIETKDIWMKVKMGKRTGWISKLFVTNHKPVGNADLMKDVKQNLATTSRRRPSSYSVSATARGLMTSERGREGREMYETDGEALDKIEKYSLPKDSLKKFKTNGKLNID
ncbi:MAG: hypothetical protein HYR96_15535 [Deltaproteobacteria bacterium]|nr:hypothetical protein [Deltaproteobacteria bacterium]MBI3296344.1 hypothetical protein [Deltaproteobacteria bacterium]